jgi:hypothetical protein
MPTTNSRLGTTFFLSGARISDNRKAYYSVFVITGPHQSGKTTLCKNHFEGYSYFNLEDLQIREQIAVEPKPFLEKYAEKGIILDEVQRYPELFSLIQVIADERPNCKFVLTGSSNFSLMQKITQSLAGRAALFSLLPFSIPELKDFDLSDTDDLLFGGGFPAVRAKQTDHLNCFGFLTGW